MLDTTLGPIVGRGVVERPGLVIADAGYWHSGQIQAITGRGIEVLIPPDGTMRDGHRSGWENGL
jgi:hypothetical protein